jgi:hypothetical protein
MQTIMFADESSPARAGIADVSSSTFIDNMRLPVHRWFRYSAGFSARWAESAIRRASVSREGLSVLDPFAGSGTTLLAAQAVGVPSYGVEAHPFVARVAQAKLLWTEDPASFVDHAHQVLAAAVNEGAEIDGYPSVIRAAFEDAALADLDKLRRAQRRLDDGSPSSELSWLALVSILRSTSHVGTAQWQYVLPNKRKARVAEPCNAFREQVALMALDMSTRPSTLPPAVLIKSDARTCAGVPDNSVDLVVTSPPYANNYDYADATRLEMSFLGEVESYGDLQSTVRDHLMRSCSQHVNERTVDLDAVLTDPVLRPIADELTSVCRTLAEVRLSRGGKKNYHLMIATYFHDMAHVWRAVRRVCRPDADVCLVIGDSAPYGIYVPVVEWNGALAKAAGFGDFSFEKTRDRNIKWKNRKHRVPLVEGRLCVGE